MEHLLLIEDADSLREVLISVLGEEGYSVHAFSSAEEALPALSSHDFSCIVSDFRLPGMDGVEFLRNVRQMQPTTPILIMTAFGSIDLAVKALKEGANDFITKPFEPQRLIIAVRELIEHKRIVDRSASLASRRTRHFVGSHPSVEKLLTQAKKVAQVTSSVLILGESGTGKELLARFIHENSPRRDKPFVAVNCAATPADLLESEFFGHEAGAFTGATQSRAGVFELASQGTIFLDEIGEMPLQLQVKLLRALQEHEIKRVGGSRTIKVRPRVIAATNQDIQKALETGGIRDDLYYRVAVVSLTIPPLRERPCDIEMLINYFLNYFSTEMEKEFRLSDEAREQLLGYYWPGNARELENIIERACVLSSGVIGVEDLGIHEGLNFKAIEQAAGTLSEIAAMASQKAELALIRRTLDRAMGNKSKAAKILGVSYKTLLHKVKEYHL